MPYLLCAQIKLLFVSQLHVHCLHFAICTVKMSVEVLGSQDVTRCIREASSAAASKIGNANAQMSRMRREKYVASLNRELVPLVKENADFATVAPNLFGPDFSKRATDHLEQVSRLRKKSHPHPYQRGSGQKVFFKGASPRRGDQPEEGAEDPTITRNTGTNSPDNDFSGNSRDTNTWCKLCKLYHYKTDVEKCCFNKRLSCINSGDGHINSCD